MYVGGDHAKILENFCSSDKKELTSSCEREFPSLTCSSMFRLNSGCSRKGSGILGSSCSVRLALSYRCYLVGVSSLCCLTSYQDFVACWSPFMSIWPCGVKKLNIWWYEDGNAFIALIQVLPKMALKDEGSSIIAKGTKAVTSLAETGNTISPNELVCYPLKPTNTLLGL